MTDHPHTPDRHRIGSSVRRSDGSCIVASDCTTCGRPVQRVKPFGVRDEENPNPWVVYDLADTTPLERIQPAPDPGVRCVQADCLDLYAPNGLQIRLRDCDAWQNLAKVSPMDRETCEITLTAADGKTAKVWATRSMQIRRVKERRCGQCVLCDTVWPCVPARLSVHIEASERGLVRAELRDDAGGVVARRDQVPADSIGFATALMCIDSSAWSA